MRRDLEPILVAYLLDEVLSSGHFEVADRTTACTDEMVVVALDARSIPHGAVCKRYLAEQPEIRERSQRPEHGSPSRIRDRGQQGFSGEMVTKRRNCLDDEGPWLRLTTEALTSTAEPRVGHSLLLPVVEAALTTLTILPAADTGYQ
jgi:hypothetical protein